MKTLAAPFLAFCLVACSEKDTVEAVRPDPKAPSAEEWRNDLIDFSTGIGDMASSHSEVSVEPKPEPKPLSALPASKRPPTTRRIPKQPKEPDFELPPPSAAAPTDLPGDRPFTPEEISRYILDRYTRAQAMLLKRDPGGLRLIEEGQTYSKDGSFHLLRAEWALSTGDPETALVQAEQATRRPIALTLEGPKKASLLICKALDSIKAAKPSDEAIEKASAAWLKYNLTYSP